MNQICGPDVVVPIEEVGLVVIMLAAIGIMFKPNLDTARGSFIFTMTLHPGLLSNVCFVAEPGIARLTFVRVICPIWIVGVLSGRAN